MADLEDFMSLKADEGFLDRIEEKVESRLFLRIDISCLHALFRLDLATLREFFASQDSCSGVELRIRLAFITSFWRRLILLFGGGFLGDLEASSINLFVDLAAKDRKSKVEEKRTDILVKDSGFAHSLRISERDEPIRFS